MLQPAVYRRIQAEFLKEERTEGWSIHPCLLFLLRKALNWSPFEWEGRTVSPEMVCNNNNYSCNLLSAYYYFILFHLILMTTWEISSTLVTVSPMKKIQEERLNSLSKVLQWVISGKGWPASRFSCLPSCALWFHVQKKDMVFLFWVKNDRSLLSLHTHVCAHTHIFVFKKLIFPLSPPKQ